MRHLSIFDILRLIDTPNPGESAEGCRTIWLCKNCHHVHHETVIEVCPKCGEKAYPYVQGDTYSALAKKFLEVIRERDDFDNALFKCAAENKILKALATPPKEVAKPGSYGLKDLKAVAVCAEHLSIGHDPTCQYCAPPKTELKTGPGTVTLPDDGRTYSCEVIGGGAPARSQKKQEKESTWTGSACIVGSAAHDAGMKCACPKCGPVGAA